MCIRDRAEDRRQRENLLLARANQNLRQDGSIVQSLALVQDRGKGTKTQPPDDKNPLQTTAKNLGPLFDAMGAASKKAPAQLLDPPDAGDPQGTRESISLGQEDTNSILTGEEFPGEESGLRTFCGMSGNQNFRVRRETRRATEKRRSHLAPGSSWGRGAIFVERHIIHGTTVIGGATF